MLDGKAVDDLCVLLSDRYTPTELIEILNVSTQDVFMKFMDECLEVDWSEVIE